MLSIFCPAGVLTYASTSGLYLIVYVPHSPFSQGPLRKASLALMVDIVHAGCRAISGDALGHIIPDGEI